MKVAVNTLSNEVREKLLELDRLVGRLWDLSDDDPEYPVLHDTCRDLQDELIGRYGLTPELINAYTYGEGGLLYG